MLLLRILHIFLGAFWAGTILFLAIFLEPSLRSIGPDAGKVMMALFKRRLFSVMPFVAIVTVLSGFWMLWIVSKGFSSVFMGSRFGIALSTGGLLGTIAMLIGAIVIGPTGNRNFALMSELATADEARRGAIMAEMGRLRTKSAVAARIVAALVAGAVLAMASARYL